MEGTERCRKCRYKYDARVCRFCLNFNKYNPMTNSMKIRAMTDEELAEFLLKVNTAYAEPCMIDSGECKWEDYPTHDKGCKDCFLEWLKSESKE